MSPPWMPLYVADYLADTSHLSAAEHGAYMLLIMHYWQRGCLPSDDRVLSRIARMTAEEWHDSKPIIAEFFGEGWSHARIDGELSKAAALSEKAREKAAKRWHKPDDAAAVPQHMPQQCQSHSQPQSIGSNEPIDLSLGGSDDHAPVVAAVKPKIDPIAEPFERFWSIYPKRKGDNPRKTALERFRAAAKAGHNPEKIIAGAAEYARRCRAEGNLGTRFVAQAATWINRHSWQDYDAKPAQPIKDDTLRYRQALDLFKLTKGAAWPSDLGPRPDCLGCRAPPDLLSEYGLDLVYLEETAA